MYLLPIILFVRYRLSLICDINVFNLACDVNMLLKWNLPIIIIDIERFYTWEFNILIYVILLSSIFINYIKKINI